MKEIEDLKVKLASASRTQAKYFKDQINELQSEKNKVLREVQKVEDQIEKRQMKIEKLNEQAHKTSIKNQMIGKDCDRNEYWFFKEETGKLFVKKVNTAAPKQAEAMQIDEEEKQVKQESELMQESDLIEL